MRWTKPLKATAAVLLALLLLAYVFVIVRTLSEQARSVERFDEAAQGVSGMPNETESQPGSGEGTVQSPGEEPKSYQSPVDFQSLQVLPHH